MRFKILDIEILGKTDTEMVEDICKARINGFATHIDDFYKYIFIAEIFWDDLNTNPRLF